MSRPYLSVIIPAYNEAGRLPLTLIDIDRHLSAQDFTSEIIVALSPSSDNTAEILKRFQTIIKNLKVVPLIENQGKGFALRQGMAQARGSFRLTMDADNSTAVIELAKMLPYLTAKDADAHDVVIGSRFIPGSHIDPPQPGGQRLASAIGRGLIRTFITKDIRDTGCGFKCFSAHAAETIFPQCRANAWAIETEAVAVAQKLGFRVKEIPVFWSYDPTGRTRSSLAIVGEHLSLWWRLINKRYSLPKS
jgi:dolichyl-phosphate beta-glucosyltransferase